MEAGSRTRDRCYSCADRRGERSRASVCLVLGVRLEYCDQMSMLVKTTSRTARSNRSSASEQCAEAAKKS